MNVIIEMIEKINSFFAVWTTIIVGITTFFSYWENVVSLEDKKKTSDWLKSLPIKSVSKTLVESPLRFIEVFDWIFGDKHLTWHCFLRSCLASIFSVTIMTIIMFFFNNTVFEDYDIEQIYFIYTAAFALNILPDYISLLETRYIFRNVINAGIQKLSVLLIFDVIITTVIFFVGAFIFGGAFFYGSDMGILLQPSVLFSIPELFYVIFINRYGFGCIFFYSTFFTSICLYLFIVLSITIKFLIPLGRFGNWVTGFLDINKPFLLMGAIIILVVTLFFAITVIISLFAGICKILNNFFC